jgi:hypothetical protein
VKSNQPTTSSRFQKKSLGVADCRPDPNYCHHVYSMLCVPTPSSQTTLLCMRRRCPVAIYVSIAPTLLSPFALLPRVYGVCVWTTIAPASQPACLSTQLSRLPFYCRPTTTYLFPHDQRNPACCRFVCPVLALLCSLPGHSISRYISCGKTQAGSMHLGIWGGGWKGKKINMLLGVNKGEHIIIITLLICIVFALLLQMTTRGFDCARIRTRPATTTSTPTSSMGSGRRGRTSERRGRPWRPSTLSGGWSGSRTRTSSS